MSQKIPQLDLRIQYPTIEKEVEAAALEVLRSGHYILGPKVKAFEEEAARYLKAPHAIGVANGSDALVLALRALGVGPGDHVVVPTFTFIASASCVNRVGATPVFADIDPRTFNLCVDSMSREMDRSRAKVVIPVHLFGIAADLDPIVKAARQREAAVVEDTAQAMGGEYKGKKLGTVGDIGTFSFFPSKNLGAFGDAGMLSTNKAELRDAINSFRVHGAASRYVFSRIGYNSRLDEMQAAILSVKLRYLDRWNRERRQVADTYRELFAEREMLADDHARPGPGKVGIPTDVDGHECVYHQYVVRIGGGARDRVQEHLTKHEIGNSIYYPIPLHLQECYRSLNYKEGAFPEAERACREVLALPIYPEMTREQLVVVRDRLYEALKKG